MKGKIKIITFFIMATAFMLNTKQVNAATTADGKYEYTSSGGNACIDFYYGNEVDVVIPSSVDGYTVTTIGVSAFNEQAGAVTSNISTITVPDTVTEIEQNAFRLLDDVTITINSYNVSYPPTTSGNIVFSPGSTAHKLYVRSRSGSSTETYYNNYYVSQYYDNGSDLKWNELCSQVFYTNIDWTAPDSIAFTSTSDITSTVSTTEEKLLVDLPKIDILDNGVAMDGNSSLSPFNDYSNVKLMYSTTLGGTKSDLAFITNDSSPSTKGLYRCEFTTAGTYYVYPVYVRKAGSSYLSSLYVSDSELIGNPIKVVVNKKNYVPTNSSIVSKYKAYGSSTLSEITNNSTVTINLPAFGKDGELYLYSYYNSPVYSKTNYNYDSNCLLNVSIADTSIATTTSAAYAPDGFESFAYKVISPVRSGSTKVTVTNGYGYKLEFTLNIKFVYGSAVTTSYSSNNMMNAKIGKTYKISDLVNISWMNASSDADKNGAIKITNYPSTGSLLAEPVTYNGDGTITINGNGYSDHGEVGIYVPNIKYGYSLGTTLYYVASNTDYSGEPNYTQVTTENVNLTVGQTKDIKASTDTTYSVAYTLENSNGVASVDANGIITALAAGSTQVKAKSPTSTGYRIYNVTVTQNSDSGTGSGTVVTPPAPEVKYYNDQVVKDITLYLNSATTTQDVTFADGGTYGGAGYTISGSGVLLNGTVAEAKAEGSSVIVVKPVRGSGFIQYNITVKDGSFDVNCKSKVSLLVKKSFSAKVTEFGVANDSISAVSTSNSKIATVSQSNSNTIKITGKKKGTATITIITQSGVTKSIKVSVSNSSSLKPSVSVSKSKVTIKKSESYTITPVINSVVKNGKITYSSTNKKIATVNSSGLVTAKKKKGTCNIEIKMDGKVVKTVKITVK